MELRALSLFAAVAETGSFTRAARKLDMSQSAVSQGIRTLEAELGTPLFTRHTRRVELAQAGDVLLPYARQILQKAAEARAVVSDFETSGRGRVTIGAGGAFCLHALPELLREFASRYGRIDIAVVSGSTEVTVQRTINGEVDLGFVVLPVQHAGLETVHLTRDELVAVAPAGHEFTKLDAIRARDFEGMPFVTYDRDSRTYRSVERFFLEAGVFPTIAMQISDLTAVKRMVAVGLGVSVVARWTVQEELRAGTLIARPLRPKGLFRNWGLVHRSRQTLTASQKNFLEICKPRVTQLLADEE